jgi:hypothetical protein
MRKPITKLSGKIRASLAMILMLSPLAARAASLSGLKDMMGNQRVSVASNHQVTFVTPSGVDASSDSIVLAFGSSGSFTLTGVAFDDVDLGVDSSSPFNDCSGTFTEKTLAASAAAGVWGVGISGQNVTLTPPTDASAGEIGTSRCVRVLIGTNAVSQSTGDNRITNPSSAANYFLSVTGGFGDTGSTILPLIDDGDVTVSATVPAGGGPPPPPPPPSAPVISGVAAGSITASSAVVTWTTDVASTSDVDYGTTTSYGSLATGGASVTSHSVNLTGLAQATLYHFRVRSTGSGTPEATSGDFTFTTLDTTAPALSNIQAVDITGTAGRVTWDTDENADSKVQYGTTISYGGETSNGTLTNAHSLDLSGLSPATLYHYRVISKDASNNSSTSTDQTFTTLDTVPPVISAISTDNITVSSARVNWTTNELADSKTSYGLTVSYGSVVSAGTLVANHQMTVSGLSANTLYHFVATSKDAAGNSATSTDQTFTTLPDTTPPANVSSLAATAGDGQVALSWLNPPDADYAGVRIRRSTTGFPATPTSGQSAYDGSGTSVTDVGLVNGTLYYYTAFAYDASGNFASGAVNSATPHDSVPPGPATGFTVTVGNGQLQLNWVNPSNPDFANVVVRRSSATFPTDPTSGTLVYTGTAQSHLDVGLTNGVTYYYAIFARDTSNNFSSAVQNSGTPAATPPSPVCGDASCESPEDNASCPADCPAPPPTGPVCGNGMCEVPETNGTCPADCPAAPGPVCGNAACEAGETSDNCVADCPVPPPPPAPPVEPPPPSTPAPAEPIDRDLIRLFSPNLTLNLRPDAGGSFHLLPRQKLTFVISELALRQPVKSIVLNFGNGSYLFRKVEASNATGWIYEGFPEGQGILQGLFVLPVNAAEIGQLGSGSYSVEITSPEISGSVSSSIIVTYEDDSAEVISQTVVVDGYGYVHETVGGQQLRLGGASVKLFQRVGGNWVQWDGTASSQANPQTTGAQGLYGFTVNLGEYYLEVTKEGYRKKETAPFTLTANVINPIVEMVRQPPPITEVIVPGAPFTENVFNVAKNITQQTTYVTKVFQNEIIQDPRVEQATRQVAVPAAVAATTIVVVSAVQATSFVSYLYFIITQPILLIGRRKRKEFGVIYHSLTKMPVDLAIVRLFRTNGRLVRTLATDKQGRYSFLVEEGEYRMEASRSGFRFPSALLGERKEDGRYLDLYHGEPIKVGMEGAVLTANIPLDPIEATKSNARILLEEIGRKLQNWLAAGSIVFTLFALAMYRQAYLLVMALVQIALFFLFRRLARPKPPKNWGIVYDETTGKPVPYAITRIVESQYNKVLASSVTDSKGRYNFLVGNNKYFVSVEKAGYQAAKTGEIDLTAVKPGEGVVDMDIALKSSGGPSDKAATAAANPEGASDPKAPPTAGPP